MKENFNGKANKVQHHFLARQSCIRNHVFGTVFGNKRTKQKLGSVVKKLWAITDGKMLLDEWSDRIIDLLPECFFAFKDYASSDFTYLTEDEYNTFKILYEDLDGDFAQLIEKVHEMEEVYAYTVIDDNGDKCSEILDEVIKILEKNSISLPDYNLVTFSKFEEKEGRGERLTEQIFPSY